MRKRDAGKEGLRALLTQALSAGKSVQTQRDRLLELRRRLQQLNPGDGDAAGVREVAAGLFKVYFRGLEYASRYLWSCLYIAADSGASPFDLEPAFAVIPDEQLYGVLLAQRLPARPTTMAEALARLEAALYAVKLPEEHHVPRCIQLLVGERPPRVTGEPFSFSGMAGYSDDPVAAAYEHLAKNGFPKPAPEAAATEPTSAASTATAKPPHAPTRMDLDQALTYLHRACSLTILAVKHIDLAVAVFSSFLDPKEVADAEEFADQHTCIPDAKEFADEHTYIPED